MKKKIKKKVKAKVKIYRDTEITKNNCWEVNCNEHPALILCHKHKEEYLMNEKDTEIEESKWWWCPIHKVYTQDVMKHKECEYVHSVKPIEQIDFEEFRDDRIIEEVELIESYYFKHPNNKPNEFGVIKTIREWKIIDKNGKIVAEVVVDG